MNIDLRKLPIIDDHCHPFMISRETRTFDNIFTLSLIPPKSEDSRNTLLYKMVRKELIELYKINPNITDDELINMRNELYHSNPKEYADMLFKDAVFESFLVDYGFPVMGPRLSQEELDWFHSVSSSVTARRIHRVEATYHRLFEEKVDFEELEKSYIRELRDEVENKGTIAFKSVIAYHTGLKMNKVSREQAAKSYGMFLADPGNRSAEKDVRDYLVLLAFELCLEYDIPIQMHSGAGDAPLLDVKLSSPLLMHGIVSDPHYQGVKIIFIHCAYPFVEEAGYLVNQYHNIHLDLSSMIPFSSIGVYSKLRKIFEMAPFTKVLYGSDGFTIPEVSWLGAKIVKKELGKVLSGLVDEGIIDEDYAYQAAGMVLSENARNLYIRNWERSMNN
ncbi:amidohydrolase family protein [Paenibacillus sp. URB8-2]|uniref:amidohydrolase family protein n=1 Tax=Paenibacillus sp. URB8-2 TaxID=2741301 RepID=UPI0015BD3F72|nr:amidohydrolase family protein [Paenibacillus sp. URB8-2]BCG61643.1 amidohydrolase [Paenibacillus sp. URB8-2]